jgi:hypothetical protein
MSCCKDRKEKYGLFGMIRRFKNMGKKFCEVLRNVACSARTLPSYFPSTPKIFVNLITLINFLDRLTSISPLSARLVTKL